MQSPESQPSLAVLDWSDALCPRVRMTLYALSIKNSLCTQMKALTLEGSPNRHAFEHSRDPMRPCTALQVNQQNASSRTN
ncbi:hypothetical protein Y1Q_0017204 [Alligator mississippiensis]|uniref:Uncharacterized protein n=1 Tax=Alligator mississippiensis TaxID=8496 RepID=A0A151NKU5_ALLMI|nr:hypothetical protein Y1Q_0017204 [Alligator mississippiensis]